MTEHDEQRPLTRRERRLREMSETGALDISEARAEQVEVVQPAAEPAALATPVAAGAGEDDIEISPVNPDGTPRSRREMRQLREEALAARAAQAAPVVEVVPEPEPAVEPLAAPEPFVAPEPVVVPEPLVAPEPVIALEPVIAPEPVAEQVPIVAEPVVAPQPVAEPMAPVIAEEPTAVDAAPAMDFDSLISPPTEAFTVEELQEAQTAARAEGIQAESFDVPVVPEESPVVADVAPVAEEEVKPKRRFWKRGKDSEEPAVPAVEAPVEAVEAPQVAPTVAAEVVEAEIVEPIAQTPVVPEPVLTEPVAFEPPVAEPVAPESVVQEPVAFAPPVAAAPVAEPVDVPEVSDPEPTADTKSTAAYSFPDIQPPEEWRSVFDDPNSRTTPVPGKRSEESGDFDDLISRAVAQEGAAGTSNTSALILPAMPDDTGGLKGPLGGTGELYLTGSIELPKSLGETGGHSALHDSIEMDPIIGAEVPESQITADQGPSPVAARHAVSARVASGAPVVAKPTKEHSKLPLVLALTGGGLLVVVVGFGIWGATNGMFG